MVKNTKATMDFFEIDRVMEELSHTFGAPCATTWFKVSRIKNPTVEEYRNKVVSFMNLFDSAFFLGFPSDYTSADLRIHVRDILRSQIESVISGANKEVEKRYKYYVSHG